MQYIIISSVALVASLLTLLSGFGLATVLMPAFALFFPLVIAVSATAVVHLANNLFRLVLLRRKASWAVVLRFALPAAVAAVFGALLLNTIAAFPPMTKYELGNTIYQVTMLKLVIGLVIIAFAVIELIPSWRNVALASRWLPLGGVLSGFFGGLSGNQGAFRSAFLIRSGLDTEAYVATGVVSSVIVDIVRLLVYGINFSAANFAAVNGTIVWPVIAAMVFSFAGSIIGVVLIKKVTLGALQYIVAVMLTIIGVTLCLGVI